jgi:hypothetical protein
MPVDAEALSKSFSEICALFKEHGFRASSQNIQGYPRLKAVSDGSSR